MENGRWKKKWFNSRSMIVQYGSMLFKEYIRELDVEKIYQKRRIGFEAKFTGLGQGSGCHETTTVVQTVFIIHHQYEYPYY